MGVRVPPGAQRPPSVRSTGGGSAFLPSTPSGVLFHAHPLVVVPASRFSVRSEVTSAQQRAYLSGGATELAQHAPFRSCSAKKFAQRSPSCGVFALAPIMGPSRANFFAHRAQRGNCETAITSASEKRAQNAYFSPAKAMAVSDNRATWPTGPGCDARGRRRGLSGRPVGGRRYKRRQTNAIQIASRGPLLQSSSI